MKYFHHKVLVARARITCVDDYLTFGSPTRLLDYLFPVSKDPRPAWVDLCGGAIGGRSKSGIAVPTQLAGVA